MTGTATQTGTVTKGLLVRIEASPGREAEVEAFLNGGLEIVMGEPATTAWFAIKLGPSTYGIFDVFPDDAGRDAHLGGKVAAALMDNVGELYGQPTLEKLDVLASKLPGG
ncbi:MAG: antibiotic biosynthesis monooxygenase [Solirubrobacterales bacterium]|nr:antibiotic biosynthesis monooxygenase [Solirubrobacterales bacterium]